MWWDLLQNKDKTNRGLICVVLCADRFNLCTLMFRSSILDDECGNETQTVVLITLGSFWTSTCGFLICNIWHAHFNMHTCSQEEFQLAIFRNSRMENLFVDRVMNIPYPCL